MAAIAGYTLFLEQTLWKKVFLTISLFLLFPLSSADYRLIFIFIPLFMFVNEKEVSGYDLFYALIFALLLIPKNYYFFPPLLVQLPGKFGNSTAAIKCSISVILTPLILLTGITMIMNEGLQKWAKGRK